MNTMDDQRRQRLADKFGHNNRPDPNNAQVQAMLRAERIAAAVGEDNLGDMLLTDPAWCPAMHAKVTAELAALHALERESGGAVYQTFRGEVYNPTTQQTLKVRCSSSSQATGAYSCAAATPTACQRPWRSKAHSACAMYASLRTARL